MQQQLKFFNIKWIPLVVFILFGSAVYAQQTVTGTVSSQPDGFPLPGANILVKGTTIGATTDMDGKYSIEVEDGTAILVFSYVGFTPQKVAVGDQTVIDVVLIEDASQLSEIVVVGYGARRKSDVTGSVSSVKADELTAFPVLEATQALQGRATGVVVQSNNGGEPVHL